MTSEPRTAGVPFDYAACRAAIDRLRAKTMFFVGGVPKSGTTWLQVLLNGHPDVSCTGEGHFPTSLAPRVRDALGGHDKFTEYKSNVVLQGLVTFPHFNEGHFRFLLAEAIALLLAASPKASSASAVGEKTPDNIRAFPMLADMFPEARFIHIMRDPRDCAVSAWFHNLRVNADALRSKFPDLSAFARHMAGSWATDVGNCERFMTAAAPRCLTLRYEDLEADPHRQLERVFKFLGVNAWRNTIRDCLEGGAFSRMSGGRDPGTEDRASFLRRGVVGDWRNHLSAEDDKAFQDAAGALMARYRYVGAATRVTPAA